MKIEIVDPQVLSTTKDEYKEISNGVYQRDRDNAVMVVGADGYKAVLVSIGRGGTE